MSTTRTIELCTAHPYRRFYAIFWLGVALLLGRFYLLRPDALLIALIAAGLLAALYNWIGRRCVRVEDGRLLSVWRPLGRFARRSWPFESVVAFTWDANRQVDDPSGQIRTRPLKFNLYAQFKSGRFQPLLTYYVEEQAAEAAGRLNALLEVSGHER